MPSPGEGTRSPVIPTAQFHSSWVQTYTQYNPLLWVRAEHRANALPAIPADALTPKQVCFTSWQWPGLSSPSLTTENRSQHESRQFRRCIEASWCRLKQVKKRKEKKKKEKKHTLLWVSASCCHRLPAGSLQTMAGIALPSAVLICIYSNHT